MFAIYITLIIPAFLAERHENFKFSASFGYIVSFSKIVNNNRKLILKMN